MTISIWWDKYYNKIKKRKNKDEERKITRKKGKKGRNVYK